MTKKVKQTPKTLDFFLFFLVGLHQRGTPPLYTQIMSLIFSVLYLGKLYFLIFIDLENSLS